ncbi:unnamed protein product [Rhizophagus irregularis]|nr:unnamed protein product [Rhizophagus irregularis]
MVLGDCYMSWFLTYRVKVDKIWKVTIKEEENETIIHLRIEEEEDFILVDVHIIIRLKEKKVKLILEDGNNMIIEERPIEKGLGWVRSKLIIGNEKYIRRIEIPRIKNKSRDKKIKNIWNSYHDALFLQHLNFYNTLIFTTLQPFITFQPFTTL